MSLKRNKYLEKYLQETIGVENMSDWMMDVFDHNGDEMLDRDEFFHMYKVIRPDEMNKTMNEKFKKEKETPRRRRRKLNDEL